MADTREENCGLSAWHWCKEMEIKVVSAVIVVFVVNVLRWQSIHRHGDEDLTVILGFHYILCPVFIVPRQLWFPSQEHLYDFTQRVSCSGVYLRTPKAVLYSGSRVP